jgi:hypothetical protein
VRPTACAHKLEKVGNHRADRRCVVAWLCGGRAIQVDQSPASPVDHHQAPVRIARVTQLRAMIITERQNVVIRRCQQARARSA